MRTSMWMGALAVVTGLLFGGAVRADDHLGPHKGPVVEWGEEEYHLEVVPDAKAGTVTVYVYGNHKEFEAAKQKAIDAKALVLTVKGDKAVTVTLTPKPERGEAAGMSSVFVGKNDVFTKGGKLEGSVSGKVGTKPYSGEFKQK